MRICTVYVSSAYICVDELRLKMHSSDFYQMVNTIYKTGKWGTISISAAETSSENEKDIRYLKRSTWRCEGMEQILVYRGVMWNFSAESVQYSVQIWSLSLADWDGRSLTSRISALLTQILTVFATLSILTIPTSISSPNRSSSSGGLTRVQSVS